MATVRIPISDTDVAVVEPRVKRTYKKRTPEARTGTAAEKPPAKGAYTRRAKPAAPSGLSADNLRSVLDELDQIGGAANGFGMLVNATIHTVSAEGVAIVATYSDGEWLLTIGSGSHG